MHRTLRRTCQIALATAALVAAGAEGTAAQLADAAREVEPVVMTGADLPAWSGPPATTTCMPYS
jgi:hypothetical protein